MVDHMIIICSSLFNGPLMGFNGENERRKINGQLYGNYMFHNASGVRMLRTPSFACFVGFGL